MNTVCVVGAGTMGAQIGLNCASYGYTVWIVDPSGETREKALQSHIQALDARVQEQKISSQEKQDILSRIHLTENLKEGASVADLVIEAVPERLDLKRDIFRQLDRLCPGHTILATTSAIGNLRLNTTYLFNKSLRQTQVMKISATLPPLHLLKKVA